MPDRLRSMINKHDRNNARVHRLTGEPVMPPRGNSNKKRVCSKCWHVVDEAAEQAEYLKWEARTMTECHCPASIPAPWLNSWKGHPRGWSHWVSAEHRWIVHEWPGVLVCPRCGADALGEVVV